MSQCPACQKPLIVYEFHAVEIDRCLECRGTWLDAGEMALLLEVSGQSTERWTDAMARAKHAGRSDRRCPSCSGRLRKLEISPEEGSAVEVDRCPKGHGIWLDHGEMESLLQRFSKEPAAGFLAELLRSERGGS